MFNIDIPLVSIVCPIFHPNIKFIEELIISINRQTYENIELIFSVEGEGEIFLSYLKNSKFETKIVYNNTSQYGIFSNLNNALKNAKGEFIQLICQDDIMFDYFIENQVKCFEKGKDIGLVFSQFDYIDFKNQINNLESRFDFRFRWPDYFTKKNAQLYLFRYGCLPGNLSPVMLKSIVFEDIGFFDQKYPYAGDFEYWTRVSEKYSFYFLKSSGLAIRRHSNQASKILGNNILLNDLKRIYEKLALNMLENNSKIKVKIYVNELIGRQFAYGILKNILTFNFTKALNTLQVFNGIFNFWISLFFVFITVNGRFQITNLYGKSFK